MSNQESASQVSPTACLVILGATGDLVARKILPALYSLEEERNPPAGKVIIFTRRDLSTAEYLESHVRPALEKRFGDIEESVYEALTQKFVYIKGDYESPEDFEKLRAEIGEKPQGPVLLYAAVFPRHMKDVFGGLSHAGIERRRGIDLRILIEKPFGENLKNAQMIQKKAHTLAGEEVYNIDHYVAKPALRWFRGLVVHNPLLAHLFDRPGAEVHVRLFEAMGVEERGRFYDSVGAFIDVGQNHMMQMLSALVPVSAQADDEAISEARERILRSVNVIRPDRIDEETIRAQYEGYRDIENVDPASETETYFRIATELSRQGGKEIPIVFEGGKRVGTENVKEIEIAFEPDAAADAEKKAARNAVIFRIEPKEEVEIVTLSPVTDRANDRREGRFDVERATIPFKRDEHERQYVEEYADLLEAASRGEKSLFLSTDEALLLWEFAEPITEGWKTGNTPLRFYEKNTYPLARTPSENEDREENESDSPKNTIY